MQSVLTDPSTPAPRVHRESIAIHKPSVAKPAARRLVGVCLRLYLTRGTPSSEQALADVEAVCQQHLDDGWDLEVVDVTTAPLRPLDDGVLGTPTLLKLSPSPEAMIVGDLARIGDILAGLLLPPSSREIDSEREYLQVGA
jgi:circadian clock protein KaiB